MYASTLLVEWTEQKEGSQNASVFSFEDNPFSTTGPLALRMSTCIFYKNSFSELLNQKLGSTLLVECTYQKEVSQNASL